MVLATFEHESNFGTLIVKTHFGATVLISCDKKDGEIFRLGGTGVNEVAILEGVILGLKSNIVKFRAFTSEKDSFDGEAVLSPEKWDDSDLHCYIIEYYDLFMEGKPPGWLACKSPLKDANRLFINLDVIDGGSNLIKRYRVSPFTGKYRLIHG
jgi:hypothetical protein